ncbi:hypothetical protein NST17_07485 [Caldifermentibacillus hisashii]|uniref:Uncharacterized protein n=1 Tax=Caldifermentibacillus hisashii TaxID=996558 RepID=A0ABU9JW05_9BACI
MKKKRNTKTHASTTDRNKPHHTGYSIRGQDETGAKAVALSITFINFMKNLIS